MTLDLCYHIDAKGIFDSRDKLDLWKAICDKRVVSASVFMSMQRILPIFCCSPIETYRKICYNIPSITIFRNGSANRQAGIVRTRRISRNHTAYSILITNLPQRRPVMRIIIESPQSNEEDVIIVRCAAPDQQSYGQRKWD